MTERSVEILVCTKCRRGQSDDAGAVRPGLQLLQQLSSQPMPTGVTLHDVTCLSNCSNGCSIALRGPGRWTYVYGNLHETSHTDAIIDGVTKYQATQDGVVPWRERPDHFRKNCIARIPPLEIPNA
ncbi:MAG: DUF1636 domain-containing protein [Paracoccaceae bacterium]|jgi:predicted metal-binding protein|nr:DUF1636 domain-containing protein [Paracoccaceae bacterium]